MLENQHTVGEDVFGELLVHGEDIDRGRQDGSQLLIDENLSPVGGVLQLVRFYVRPELLHHLPMRVYSLFH